MLARSRSYVNIPELSDRFSLDHSDNEGEILTFEKEFSRYLNAPISFATNQARAALLIGLKSLHLSPGDEVIVQSFTYHGVLNALFDAGVTPVLVDNSLRDFNLSGETVRKKITKNTKVIIATHLFGIPCDIEDITDIAAENNCVLIEDCAQCLGAEYKGTRIGTFGDMAVFSFNFEKHMSTGQGGMLTVNNEDLIEEVQKLLETYKRVPIEEEKCYVYGLLIQHILQEKDMYHTSLPATFGEEWCRKNSVLFNNIDEMIKKRVSEEYIRENVSRQYEKEKPDFHISQDLNRGPLNLLRRFDSLKTIFSKPSHEKVECENLKMNVLRARAGTWGLKHLDETNKIRNENAIKVMEFLEGIHSYQLPIIDTNKSPVHLKFNVLNLTRHSMADIKEKARVQGYEMGNYQWPSSVHLSHPYQKLLTYQKNELTTSEYIADRIINIPIHPYVTDEDIIGMVTLLKEL